ncbi:SCO6880 family protein [Nocardiopsis aegyptia]|uniref:SCO6880 family protein n=1 Tax=Nocardiopsis aegyptia TaxID=220378 RepID=UPI00366BFD94
MSTPLYGGWRRSRSLGIGNLNGRQTVMLAVAVAVPLMVATLTDLTTTLAVVPAALLLALGAILVVRGVWVVDLALAAAGFYLARMRGQTSYRAQMWAPYPRVWDLPGVLAPTELLELYQPGVGDAGIVWNQRTGAMTATYLLSPTGALLADHQTVTHQVGAWGSTLATLANDTSLSHATVTIDLTPALGTQLPAHVAERTDPTSPQLARQVMNEVVQAAPSGTTHIRARLSLTTRNRTRQVDEAVVETLRSLGALSLHAAGVDVLRRASADDLAKIVRSAFDPSTEQDHYSSDWSELSWHEVGPVAAEEEWGHYVHDGAYSTTWCLVEPPRQQVPHHVLLPLLLPGPYPVRLSIQYRTLSREEAGSVLKREQDAATARRIYQHRTGRDPSARDEADDARANQAAAEEAQGAGLVQFSVFVTTTAPTLEQLHDAKRHVEQAVSEARLRMRPCWGGQSAAFATNLGVAGLYPPDL